MTWTEARCDHLAMNVTTVDSVDRIGLTPLHKQLMNVCDEMAVSMMRSAYSPIFSWDDWGPLSTSALPNSSGVSPSRCRLGPCSSTSALIWPIASSPSPSASSTPSPGRSPSRSRHCGSVVPGWSSYPTSRSTVVRPGQGRVPRTPARRQPPVEASRAGPGRQHHLGASRMGRRGRLARQPADEPPTSLT